MDALEVLEQGHMVAGISVRQPTGSATDAWNAVDQAWEQTAPAWEQRAFETGSRQGPATAEGRGVNKEDLLPNSTPWHVPQS